MLVKRCTESTIVTALMAIVDTAQAIAGVAYTPTPRMPAAQEAKSRARVRTILRQLWQRTGLAEGMETTCVLRGKSRHTVRVTKVKHRPIIIFAESLKQDPVRRAQAVAFELLDVKGNGMPSETIAACVYDPPSDDSTGKLAEADRILETYFDAGVFSVAEEARIVRTAKTWVAR